MTYKGVPADNKVEEGDESSAITSPDMTIPICSFFFLSFNEHLVWTKSSVIKTQGPM